MSDGIRRLDNCKCCGQPVWTAPICGCAHSVLVHDLNPKNERTKCLTAVGPKGEPCGCSRFVEVKS